MLISFSPVHGLPEMELSRAGDVLTVNGIDYDFSSVANGDVLPRAAVSCNLLESDVTRVGGVLQFTLLLPHSETAPQETLFPDPVSVAIDGPITIPPYEAP